MQTPFQSFIQPVLAETRENLARSWARLPHELRTGRQMLGKQGNGCGATIGAMPRCDFACRGCYLGGEANTVPAESVEALKAQMRALRPRLGNAGNLQLTDGEVTLRPAAEVAELLRYAREIGLIPMLMTHGDSFRRRPGLLEQLMVDGGLVEVSIHIDTTQRGRVGDAYRRARTEAELNPLRDEMAAIVRAARRATGLPLRCATTITVTAENLDGVPDVIRWLTRNGDAFRMISFQPIAEVGRTEEGLGGGVSVDALWDRVADGLFGDAGDHTRLCHGEKWLGHPACNLFVHGLVAHDRATGAVAFHPVREEGDAVDTRVVDGVLARFGGLSFRADDRVTAIARGLGMLAAAPGIAARNLVPFLRHWARRLAPDAPRAAFWRVLRGRLAVSPLVIVSHHFMTRAEIETPLGRERLDLCVFQVPVGDQMISMCEVNALGVRDRYYADLVRARREATAAV